MKAAGDPKLHYSILMFIWIKENSFETLRKHTKWDIGKTSAIFISFVLNLVLSASLKQNSCSSESSRILWQHVCNFWLQRQIISRSHSLLARAHVFTFFNDSRPYSSGGCSRLSIHVFRRQLLLEANTTWRRRIHQAQDSSGAGALTSS